MKEAIKSQFDSNLSRVKTLVEVYRTGLATGKQGRRPVGSADILRAATVFLHATVEEVIRSILAWRLPLQDEAQLNLVPITGSDGERAEKFFLGRLVSLRGQTIDQVLKASVYDWLKRSNYNDVKELNRALTAAGLDVEPLKILYPEITKLMERRHHIVHRGDKNPATGTGHHLAMPINPDVVDEWVAIVERLFEEVFKQLPS